MTIAFVQPPIEDFYFTPQRRQPLGLMYLSSVIKPLTNKIQWLDFLSDQTKKQIKLPTYFSELKKYYLHNDISPFSLYKSYQHYGSTNEDILKVIERCDADIYAITCNFTPYYMQTLNICQMIKKIHPHAIVIVGGNHVSCMPEFMIEKKEIDFIILGEGERPFYELISVLKGTTKQSLEDIKSIGFKNGSRQIINYEHNRFKNLDEIPFPDRSFIDFSKYEINRRRSTMIVATRGCPHSCKFCSSEKVFGSKYRKRSVTNIIEEMKICREKFNITSFDFEDDNMTFDKDFAFELFTGIIDEFGQNTLQLFAMNGIEIKNLDIKLLEIMKRAGFSYFNISLVSQDFDMQSNLNRPKTSTQNRCNELIESIDKIKNWAVIYIIVGLPEQIIKDLIEIICNLMEKPVIIGPSVFYLTPSTKLFNILSETNEFNGFSLELCRSSAVYFENSNIDRKQIITIFRLVRMVNFIKQCIHDGFLSNYKSISEYIDHKKLFDDLTADSDNTFQLSSLVRQNNTSLGFYQICLLLKKKKLYMVSLKIKNSKYTYSFEEYLQSYDVINMFLEEANDKQVSSIVDEKAIEKRKTFI